jgi:hypothetical protein
MTAEGLQPIPQRPRPVEAPHPRPRRLALVRTPRRPAVVRALAIVAGLLLVCGSAAWLWPPQPNGVTAVAGLTLARDRPPVGPIGLQEVDVPVLWSGPTAPVALITVGDSSAIRHATRVWWILGRSGDTTPWNDPVIESSHVAVTVAAHGQATVSVPAANGTRIPADGTYVLTLWAHTVLPDGSDVHSDGVQLAAPITVSALSRKLQETVIDAAANVRVLDLAAPARLKAGVPFSLTSQLGNQGHDELSVELELAATNAAGATVHSAPIDMVLDPGPAQGVPSTLTIPASWTGAVSLRTVVSVLLPDGSAIPAVRAVLSAPVPLEPRHRK